MNTSLAGLVSFGDVAAEDDAVLDYFLATDAARSIENNQVFLVLGRKGAGKTALVRHFTESGTGVPSRSVNLRGYPWNVHATRIDRGASEIEAYVAAWRYLIAIQLASLAHQRVEDKKCKAAAEIKQFFDDNYGAIQPKLGDILRPQKLRLSKYSITPSVLGNQLGGVELERQAGDLSLGRELDAVSSALLEAVLKLSREKGVGPLLLHFDELDQGLSKLDAQRSKMIVGLILAAREVRRDCGKEGGTINPVIYLRTDLWSDLEFSDKNKISQTQTLHLEWSSDTLEQLVNERLRARLGDGVRWEHVSSPDLMRGSQTKWNHIIARTFLRPRDVIAFLNAGLSIAKRRNEMPIIFKNEDIVAARDQYSTYLKKELDDEVLPHWSHWEEALQACSAISTITFDRAAFVEEYDRRKSRNNELSEGEALQVLYGFSVLGYERRSGYGGSSWAFQYTDQEAGWDSGATRFKVHLGLKEYAKLREERR